MPSVHVKELAAVYIFISSLTQVFLARLSAPERQGLKSDNERGFRARPDCAPYKGGSNLPVEYYYQKLMDQLNCAPRPPAATLRPNLTRAVNAVHGNPKLFANGHSFHPPGFARESAVFLL